MSRRVVAASLVGAGVLAGVLVALLLAGGGGDGARYAARFANARGLVAGNDVRVGGAVAGRVREVRLAPDGSAEVVFTLDRADAAPRADATAAIRPVDLLGDTYLSLSPGRAAAAQRGPIPASRTVNAPRLDELLRTFSPAVRDGLQALLVEGGLALDERGGDVARTAVALRPALEAADRVAAELDGQNASLARLVPSAERAAGQVADRAADLGPLLDGLARTLDATARRGDDLDATLAALPATLTRVRSTAGALGRTARAARPVAVTLRDSAPALAASLRQLRPFVVRLRATAVTLRPVVRLARRTLAGGAASLPKLDRAVRTLLAAAPQVRALTGAVAPAAPGIAKGFLENFPDQAAEPGRQPLDPFADPRRRYWRGAAVMSCEAFGVPVRKGCLDDVLASFAPSSGTGTRRRVRPRPDAPLAPVAPGTRPAERRPDTGARTPELPLVPTVQRLLDDLGGALSGGGRAGGDDPASGLLGYLLR